MLNLLLIHVLTFYYQLSFHSQFLSNLADFPDILSYSRYRGGFRIAKMPNLLTYSHDHGYMCSTSHIQTLLLDGVDNGPPQWHMGTLQVNLFMKV